MRNVPQNERALPDGYHELPGFPVLKISNGTLSEIDIIREIQDIGANLALAEELKCRQTAKEGHHRIPFNPTELQTVTFVRTVELSTEQEAKLRVLYERIKAKSESLKPKSESLEKSQVSVAANEVKGRVEEAAS